MAGGDFIRHAGDLGHGLSRRTGFWQRLHLDPSLLFMLTLLLGFGLFVLYSATDGNPDEMKRQAAFIGIAYAAMFVTAQIHPRIMYRWSPWFYLLGLVLLVLVLVMGVSVNGARRWLDFPGLPRFQPSEVLKIMVPMTVAWYLCHRPMPPRFMQVLVAMAIILVPAALISMQPDLGTSLLIAISGIFVVLLSGIRWRLVFSALGAGLVAAPLMWIFYLKDYQKQRVITFLDPEREPLGAGWNTIQAKTAIGSGGLHGKGWMNGTQSRLDFLPEGQTDFIVAVLSEEFGLVGVLFLLGLYVVIISRCLYICAMAEDNFTRFLAGSISLTFFVYVFVNIGMVSGILPVVGVPLPMVSLGGTSIVSLMLGFGVLMSVHTHRKTLPF